MESLLHAPSPHALSSSRLHLKSMLHHAPSHPLPSSGLDFLQEIHLRRAKTDIKAQKMTRKERSMISEGARKERTMIVEEASMILEDW
jgi:hypothetical protein